MLFYYHYNLIHFYRLKKALPRHGNIPAMSMNYTHVRKLHINLIFARWVYDLPGEFCRFLRYFGAGRSCRSNIDTGGDATGPGLSLSRRSGVRR